MEIEQKCTDFISFLNSGNNSVSNLKKKSERIGTFFEIISDSKSLVDSPSIINIIISILNISIISTQKSKCFDTIPNFFLGISKNNIPLAIEEKDTQEIIDIIKNIIEQHIPQANDDAWLFWLKLFVEFFKIPTFFNFFRKESEFDNSSINYIPIKALFTLIDNLMRYNQITTKDNYSEQRSLALKLFSIFIQKSPYPPLPHTINSIINILDPLASIELPDDDFNNLLLILSEIIPISPISFLMDSSPINSGPFIDKILNKIFDNWTKYQANPTLRKSSSFYLLLYTTTLDSLNNDISQIFIDKWIKRIIDSFLRYKNKEQILQSSEDIPYLRADIEILKRSNDKTSISKCLLQYILQNKKITSNLNIIWLFTAIGLYEPTIIEQEDWLQVLESINTFKINDAFWFNAQIFPDFLELISVMVDVIESRKHWNSVFSYLMENQPSKDQIASFYNLISKILERKRIDIKVAYKYQCLLWKEKSNPIQFSIEKLRTIQTSILFYGFADVESRSDCFSSLICLLDYAEPLSTEYLKQLALTVGSVISSYPFQLIQIKKEKTNKVDLICQQLKTQLEMTYAQEKIESPLQTDDLFFIAPECSQVQVGDDDDDNDSDANENEKEKKDESSINLNNDSINKKFELCNFITPSLQSRFISSIYDKNIINESNEWNFMLFMTSLMPNFFTPKNFYENFEKSFNENCDFQKFPSYLKTLSISFDEIKYDHITEFFEKIEENFFDFVKQYIQNCEDKIHDFFKDKVITWNLLNNIQNEKEDFLDILPLLSEFAVKCSSLIEGKEELFYSHFENYLSTTSNLIPFINLKVCSNFLKLFPPEQQEAEIINSIKNNTIQILQNLFVSINDRNRFIDELFKSIVYNNNEPCDLLFKIISNYSITPSMKSSLLEIIQNNYKTANQIFDCFWSPENYSPFFIQDEYPLIRLRSIDTITSIMKLKELSINNGYEDVSQKVEKDSFFKEFISPFIEEILDDDDWNQSKQIVFTAIKTLIQISAEIPELALKCLYMIFDSFTKHDYTIFPIQTIKHLFSGLSNRAHFSVILRQFIPILIRQLDKLTDRLNSYPFELFYLDEPNISNENAKRMFCEEASHYSIPYSIVKSKQEMLTFFESVLKKEENELFIENSVYICSYILDTIDEDFLEEDQLKLQNLYTKLMWQNNYSSPIPLLSFISMASKESIVKSYKTILDDNAFTSDFLDFRNYIYILYSKIIKSHHELIHSHYIQQFSLYLTILFTIHQEELGRKQTLYSDILALTVNMIEFVPRSKSSNLLKEIASNIPDDFNIKMVGFVKNIEDICSVFPEHECLNIFFEKFPKLINKILIFDFLKERQLEIRTPFMEFKRIAKTKRLNQESIDFLLPCFIDDSESIDSINKLPNEMKRTVLSEVYQFAIKNPQTLALHLYTEMFLDFIDIHPSPLIIDSNLNAHVLLFKKLLELARDKKSSVCKSALTALHEILSESLLPQSVMEDKFLFSQLNEYKNFARPRKKTKKPSNESSHISMLVCSYIEKLNDIKDRPLRISNIPINDIKMLIKFGNVAAESPEFCQQLFPILFDLCLRSPLFDQICKEFLHFSEEPGKYFTECRLFISTFNYLRETVLQEPNILIRRQYMNWFFRRINFQRIMEVCLKIGDPYSAYQYAEFAHSVDKIDDEPLERIFTHLGVNDLMNGLNRNLSDPLSVADIFKQEGHFGKALILYDNMNNIPMMKGTLNRLHLYNLIGSMKTSITDTNIDSLCRLRKWDVSSKIMFEMNKESHFVNLFEVMQAFATNNEDAIISKLNEFLMNFHFDLNSSVYDQLSFLLEASALEWFHAVTFNESSNLFNLFKESDINSIYSKALNKLNQLSHHFYKITKSANELHGIFYCILNKLSILQNTEISFPEIPRKFFADVISTSLENNEIESAQYFITLLSESQERVPQIAKFEQIRVLYSQNPHYAVSLFEKNYDQIRLNENDLESEQERNFFNLRVDFALASWFEQTNYLASNQIFEQLENIVEKCELNESIELMSDAEFTLARAYHHQHKEICNYFMSNEYTKINEILIYYKDFIKSEEAEKVDSTEKNVKQDIYKYESIINDKNEQFSTTICSAIENYMKVLSHTSKYDLESTFSIVGLWFDYINNKKHSKFVNKIQTNVNETIEVFYSNADPVKFLPLFHQLAARIDFEKTISQSQSQDGDGDDDDVEFQKILLKMVSSICQEKTSECFPILFSLLKSNEGKAKGKAITNLIDFITNSSADLLNHWDQMYQLLSCYVSLAKYPIDKDINEYSLYEIGPFLVQCTSENLNYITIITNTNNDVGIDHYGDKVTVFKSATLPFKIEIIGTDGVIYEQVIKGHKDDLRQDAVMQQLFTLSSKLLSKKNPNLSIRHYKVVPLSAETGVIECVKGSTPIQDYLENAHNYYNDGKNLSLVKVSTEFSNKSLTYHKSHRNSRDKYKEMVDLFVNIRRQLKPVFHYFFIERFKNTGDWFASRLRYSRHTAINSMVGYIFGIGDRHLNNILIDNKTGEVIHIDLGIAFDQGKALPVSEMVPFRLTNEIIDGMGWMGKEGVFRKICEESLAVLKENTEYLLTVLNVFMNDPLNNWILVPKNQSPESTLAINNLIPSRGENKFAESAIITCQRKLDGRETGQNLSIQGQVSKLINDATSDENLAMMFRGWRPYL